MILISHRGNIDGSVPNLENSPEHIKKAIDLGYDVEVDVWKKENQLFLGHDKPQYLIDETFLENASLWCHAKNSEALEHMLLNKKIHCFWHQSDKYTLTSMGYVWIYPGEKTIPTGILVMPEKVGIIPNTQKNLEILGVCSDKISDWRG